MDQDDRITKERFEAVLESYHLTDGSKKKALSNKFVFLKKHLSKRDAYRILAVLDREIGHQLDFKFYV